MKLTSTTFPIGGMIPARCAFGRIGADGETIASGNINPALCWSDVPAGTRSFVLACLDDDVPTVFTERDLGGEMPCTMLRRRFVHWVQVDIPARVTTIAEGELSNEKKTTPGFGRPGINDYAGGETPAPGEVGTGYDGPRPPSIDARWHFYRFMVAALDVPSLELGRTFTWADAAKAMEGRILATAEHVGRYTLNPSLAG